MKRFSVAALFVAALLLSSTASADSYLKPSDVIKQGEALEGSSVRVKGLLLVNIRGRLTLWDSEKDANDSNWHEACLTVYAPGKLSDYLRYNKKMVSITGIFYNDIARGRLDFHMCNLKGVEFTEFNDIKNSRTFENRPTKK